MRHADIMNLSDWQKCREISVFCGTCLSTNDIAQPKSFFLCRYPCPSCGLKGNLEKVPNRLEYL